MTCALWNAPRRGRRQPRRVFALAAAGALALAAPPAASAGDRYALVVTGAAGGAKYAPKYDAWRTALVSILRDRFSYPADHVIVLAEAPSPPARPATRDSVRAALDHLGRRAKPDDVVLVLLIGHGTGLDGEGAKFNLVGPDLSADEWAALVKPIAGRLVFVNTTSASFPFLRSMAAPGRLILTATDSAGQQFETVFPEYFIAALTSPAADLDKNQKVSIWEAFSHAGAAVKKWYEDRGQIPTERPALDDGAPAGGPGTLARLTYLEPDVRIPSNADAELAALLRRRAQLESAVERLRLNKPTTPQAQYERELETLLLELAQVNRQIRAKS